MKLASAIEGGLAGATTLSLLTKTLQRINGDSSRNRLLERGNLKKRLKKSKWKNKIKATKQYIGLAGDLIRSTASLGLSSLGKQKNMMLKGGLLGTAAGLGSVLLKPADHKAADVNGHEGYPSLKNSNKNSLLTRTLEVSLFTIGGMIAGKVIEQSQKKKKRKK